MRVLVADDSILFRRVMTDVLNSLPDVEVVGQAQNGKIALNKVRDLRPDLLTLDLEMPEIDGLGVLDALRGEEHRPTVIVVSALTHQGGRLTVQALQKGAFDFITKPETSSAEAGRAVLHAELSMRIKALGLRFGVRDIIRSKGRTQRAGAAGTGATTAASSAASTPSATATLSNGAQAPGADGARMSRPAGVERPEMVLIGVSTGGPNALAVLLPGLPANLSVPILIVQHMPPLFTRSLAENLAGKCRLPVREATHGETAKAGTVYIAPGGRHMRLAVGPGGGKVIEITEDPPENNCRPAVDYLFRSAAQSFPGRSLGVVLTGMGSDGTKGLRLLKSQGCRVFAQNEDSCVVYGMPKAAVDAGVVDEILTLDAMAGRIETVVGGGAS